MEEKLNKISESECLILLGDFNSHIDILGEQKLDMNRKMVLEWLGQYSLTLLNSDEKCERKYTWQKADQKSCIDFILTNGSMYDKFKHMKVDENNLEIDVSDHNLITVHFGFEGEEGQEVTEGRHDNYYFMVNQRALNVYMEDL